MHARLAAPWQQNTLACAHAYLRDGAPCCLVPWARPPRYRSAVSRTLSCSQQAGQQATAWQPPAKRCLWSVGSRQRALLFRTEADAAVVEVTVCVVRGSYRGHNKSRVSASVCGVWLATVQCSFAPLA